MLSLLGQHFLCYVRMPHGTQRLTSLRKCASSAQLRERMLRATATLQAGMLPVATYASQQGATVLHCASALLLTLSAAALLAQSARRRNQAHMPALSFKMGRHHCCTCAPGARGCLD
jgi:hypothetical protein